MANEREVLLKSGMDDYLTKPIQESQIVHTLIKWAGVDPQHPLSQSTPPSPSEPTVEEGELAIMDWPASIRLAAGKPDLARDMLIMLFNSLEQERRKISNAYADNNIDDLLNHVHYLHGATRYCGVPALRAAAQTLETALKSQLQTYQQQFAAGLALEKPRTDSCEQETNQLLTGIDNLVEWRDTNGIPE
jgi:two-component system sensor histidine kinase BarA